MNGVFVRYDERMLPCIKGYVSEDASGDYNVYINPILSFEAQRIAFAHELNHLHNCDFSNELSIGEVEGF